MFLGSVSFYMVSGFVATVASKIRGDLLWLSLTVLVLTDDSRFFASNRSTLTVYWAQFIA